MSRDRFDVLEQFVPLFEAPEPSFESFLRRRDRKRRNQRVTAGVLGIAVFALAAVGFVRLLASDRGTVIGPANPPSPTISPSPDTRSSSLFTDRFDSSINGFSIGYPSGWKTRMATEPWGGHSEVSFEAPEADVIFHPRLQDDLYIAMVSEPLDADTPGPEWADAGSWLDSVGICTDATGFGGGGGDTWAGADYAWFENCGSRTAGGSVVLLQTPTRGYIIYLHVADEAVDGGVAQRVLQRLRATYADEPLLKDALDSESFLKTALQTLSLRPQEAVDASNRSESA